MIRLIRFIITGDWHQHAWKIIQKVNVDCTLNGNANSFYVVYHCQCHICGKITSYRSKK